MAHDELRNTPHIPGDDYGGRGLASDLAGARGAIYWLGQLANRVDDYVNHISYPSPEIGRWCHLDRDDRETFAADFDCALSIELAALRALDWGGYYSELLPRAREKRLRWLTDQYRAQLPFSPTELSELGISYALVEDAEPVAVLESLRNQRFHDVVPGVHSTITRSGAELTDRWWDWRRGVGEFAVDGSHDSAMQALANLGRYLGGRWVDGDWYDRIEAEQ